MARPSDSTLTSISSTSSSMAGRLSGGRECRPSARLSPTPTSRSLSATSADSPARADSGELLDPDQEELIVLLAHGELHPVAGLEGERIEEGGARGDRHQLHGAHAERRDGLVADEDHVRGGAGDDRPANLVGGGTDDRSPDAGGEGGEERAEQEDGQRTLNGGPSTCPPSPNRTF